MQHTPAHAPATLLRCFSASHLSVKQPAPSPPYRVACRRRYFTNAHDYHGFAGKALGLRASWESPGIVAFWMKQCATGRWSRIGKFDPRVTQRRVASRLASHRITWSRAKLWFNDYTLRISQRDLAVCHRDLSVCVRDYEWTVGNNRSRSTQSDRFANSWFRIS